MSRSALRAPGASGNQWIKYEPDADIPEPKYPEDQRFKAVGLPVDLSNVSLQDITLLSVPTKWDLDTCVNYHDYKHNTHRGKRRAHAFYLGAKALDRPIRILSDMLNAADRVKYEPTLRHLSIIALGKRYEVKDQPETLYALDNEAYQDMVIELIDMRRRTEQIVGLDQSGDIPDVPEWGDSRTFPHTRMYAKNDWEILSACYRFEVEAFLKALLAYGFDFIPWQDPEGEDETDDEDERLDKGGTSPSSVRSLKKIDEALIADMTARRESQSAHSHPVFGLPDDQSTPKGKRKTEETPDTPRPETSFADALAANPFLRFVLNKAAEKSMQEHSQAQEEEELASKEPEETPVKPEAEAEYDVNLTPEQEDWV